MNIFRIIFLLLLVCFLGFTGLLLLDFLKGDGNGIVAGINFAPLAKYTFYLFLGYSFYFAFKQKIGWMQNVFMSGLMLVLTIFSRIACGTSSKTPVCVFNRILSGVAGFRLYSIFSTRISLISEISKSTCAKASASWQSMAIGQVLTHSAPSFNVA